MDVISLPKLKFPRITLKARKGGNSTFVWDIVRNSWITLTPEEWVRQHVVHYLQRKGVELHRIVLEHPVLVNGLNQRIDIAVYSRSATAVGAIIECKAPDVPLSEEVLNQALRYNANIHASIIILTNGVDIKAFRTTNDGLEILSQFPEL